MFTYFSQVLPKNLLWLWKYIREYYKKWIHFLPFTYVGLAHGPEPLPWAMSFYNLSGEVHENQMMHSVYFPPAVDVERKIFNMKYIFTIWSFWPHPRAWAPGDMNFTMLEEGLMNIIQ